MSKRASKGLSTPTRQKRTRKNVKFSAVFAAMYLNKMMQWKK